MEILGFVPPCTAKNRAHIPLFNSCALLTAIRTPRRVHYGCGGSGGDCRRQRAGRTDMIRCFTANTWKPIGRSHSVEE
jgi:hypothetical protein